MAEHGGQAAPSVAQGGCRLACSPPCALEQGVQSAHDPPWQHGRDRPGQLLRQARQGLALPVCFLSAGQRLVARRMGAEAQDRRFGKGPRERRVAALRAGGARTLPGRCLGACDHAARGHAILDPWDAGEVLHRLQQHATQDRAETRDGLEPGQGGGLLLLGRLHHGPRQVPPPLVISVEEGAVHRDAFVDRRRGTKCRVGSANRSATPGRVVVSALLVPSSGPWYWRLVCWTGVNSAARFRLRGIRRLSRSRVARMSAG